MKKILLLFAVCFICQSMIVRAQNKVVKGVVVDKTTKQIITGVSIFVKGTKSGTQTNTEGKYTITIPPVGNPVLIFRSVGYKSQEIPLGNKTQLDIQLESDATILEVVSIGYQKVSRRELTGAVSSITAGDLKNNPTLSAAEAIQGKLAGVQVVVSEGQPGAPVDIYIRGRNSITQSGSPLYIVDGVQIDNALNVLSPQDIESIDVLKDAASTAIYGARGANGVIIVTTKGGKNTGGGNPC